MSVTIDGKTTSEWSKYFKITIPPDSDPRTCVRLDSELSDLFQTAYSYLLNAEAASSCVNSVYKNQYNAEIDKLVQTNINTSGKKNHAAPTLVAIAEKNLVSYGDKVTASDTKLQFWKRIVEYLKIQKQLLENASWNLSIESKLSPYRGGSDE